MIIRLSRLPNWRSSLRDYILSVWRKPLDYGTFDCVLYINGAVKAMTGIDYTQVFQPQYTSLREGIAWIKAQGFNTHEDFVASLFSEIPPSQAHVGDIAVLKGDHGGKALGILQGDMVYVLGPTGVVMASRLDIERAFRV